MGNRVIALYGVLCLFSGVVFSREIPTAQELLEKFAQTQEVFDSFTVKTEISIELRVKALSPQYPNINQTKYNTIDLRFDRTNRRTYLRETLSGDVLPTGQDISPDGPMYRSVLFAYQGNYISYGSANPISDPGHVNINQITVADPDVIVTQAFSRAFTGHDAFGYLYGHDERVDEMLRDAVTIRVRDRKQSAGGADCYVIEASTPEGNYTLWIDPEHGYNLARAKLLIDEGDSVYERTAGEGDRYSVLLDNVKFQQVQGTWVPVEAEILYQTRESGRYTTHEKILFKAVQYNLNPDHDALGSFKPDDIQNGAQVKIIQGDKVMQSIYFWQDGQIIDDEGKVICEVLTVQ